MHNEKPTSFVGAPLCAEYTLYKANLMAYMVSICYKNEP